ncbi:aldo/keto reductase [Devosia sp.]|uniref:aldo/keto reductase n=1 Tax=Devosia sp. TaxID=1871048 RepID=UPI003A942FD4
MTTISPALKPMRIGASPIAQPPLCFGGSWYVPYGSPSEQDAHLTAAMQAAFDAGVRHFDTGAGYGGGHSEELYGRFIADKRDQIFIASKANPAEATAASMYEQVEGSLGRLGVDTIDLYYIHWPRTGWDMRPTMEGLERARAEGKIGAVGVSNFSVTEMAQVAEVGTIDAHQLGYNLLWRYPEDDVIDWCTRHGTTVITYSTLAHGILTGKFGRDPGLREGDQRHGILPFREDIWPHVYEGVEQLKAIAAERDRPLAHLAIRWALSRPGIAATIIGGRNAEQVESVMPALEGDIDQSVFDRMTAISDEIVKHVPNAGNLFGRVG